MYNSISVLNYRKVSSKFFLSQNINTVLLASLFDILLVDEINTSISTHIEQLLSSILKTVVIQSPKSCTFWRKWHKYTWRCTNRPLHKIVYGYLIVEQRFIHLHTINLDYCISLYQYRLITLVPHIGNYSHLGFVKETKLEQNL